MSIKLYNTATRSKEVFTPIDPDNVRMYVCGPTVYDRAHLGNARPVVVFDVLNRLLRHTYGDDHVTYVRNFTDVDDKINATALARKEAGAEGSIEELVRERSDETIRWYHEDMDALGTLRPDHEPRATEYIAQMVAMIADLIAKGHAYEAEGHVLFKVSSYKDYGKLSGRKVEDMIAGARVEVAPYKEDPMDFVLWKPSTDELPGWDSPWGRGRPGWHIECSAMAFELLGARFDIHGGGNDLQFPHHENEIAQSKCAGHEFANVWMHNEMLQVEGKKMSKSLGNFRTVRDVLDNGVFGLEGLVAGDQVRMAFLLSHYSTVMDFSYKRVHEARTKLDNFGQVLGKLGEQFRSNLIFKREFVDPAIVSALNDDLNTSAAVSKIQILAKDLPTDPAKRAIRIRSIHSSLCLLGFEDLKNSAQARNSASNFDGVLEIVKQGQDRFDYKLIVNFRVSLSTKDKELVRSKSIQWREFRNNKQYEKADELKERMLDAGVELRAGSSGIDTFVSQDFDPTKLEGLK